MKKRIILALILLVIGLFIGIVFFMNAPRKAYDLQRAKKYFAAGELSRAYAEYQKALKNEPNNPEIYYELGGATNQMGRIPECIELLHKAYRLDPKIIYLEELYWPYYLTSDFENAEKVCRSVLKADPSRTIYLSFLADIYITKALKERSYLQKAEETIKKGDMTKGDTFYIWGKIYWLKEDFNKAIENLEKAVRLGLDPSDEVDLQILLGHLYIWNGKMDKARESFHKIINLSLKWKRSDYLRLIPAPEISVIVLYSYWGERIGKKTLDKLYARYDLLGKKGVLDTDGGRQRHLQTVNAIDAIDTKNYQKALKNLSLLFRSKETEPPAPPPQCFLSRTLQRQIFPTLANTLKGDVYKAMGLKAEAQRCYASALKTDSRNPFVKRRIDSLK